MYKIFKNFIVDNVNHIKKISISDLLNSITLAILFFMTNVSLLYIESGMYSEIIEYLAIIFSCVGICCIYDVQEYPNQPSNFCVYWLYISFFSACFHIFIGNRQLLSREL